MRLLVASLAVVALAAFAAPASAQGQNSQWCADYGREGTTNCGFKTYEQCRATISGFNTGSCYRNPQFMGDQRRYPRDQMGR